MIRSMLSRASVILAVTATVLGFAPVASATVVPIPMRVLVYSNGDGFLVCGEGTSASTVANVWQLRVTGSRSDGSVINFAVLSTQRTFDDCIGVSKNGTAAGVVLGELTYTGVGTDVAGAFAGRATWAPVVGDGTSDSGIG